MKLYELVAESLQRTGGPVFGLMGDQNMRIVARFIESGGRFISSAHEAGAVSAADGYSRFSGRTGVASITHGPAVTNSLTALTEAVRAQSHLVLLTGATPGKHGMAQELDIAAVASSVGAGYQPVMNQATAREDIGRAFTRTRAERRPIVLDVPIDLLPLEVGDGSRPPQPFNRQRPAPDPAALDAAAGLLVSARRPVVLAGRGAILSGATEPIKELARLSGAAVATTLLAKGLFAGEPTNLGIFGTLSHSIALTEIAAADLVIAFGARLAPYTTVRNDLVRDKRIIQVDIDDRVFGRYTAIDVPVVGDAKVVAEALCEMLREAPSGGSQHAAELGQRLADRSPWDDFTTRERAGYVDTRATMLRLNSVLPGDATVVTDGGRFMYAPWKYLDVQAGSLTHTLHFGSIALALSVAIGAAVARPERLTVAILGDGAFMMHLEAFNTAVRHGVPLLVLLVNDGAYGAEYEKLRTAGVDPKHALFDWPDFVALAGSLGGQGMRVSKPEDIEELRGRLGNLTGPLLADIRVDPDVDVTDGAM